MSWNESAFSLDWAPDAIIVTTADRSVAHVNPRAESLFGYRSEEVADRPVELLIAEGLPRPLPDAPLQETSRRVVCMHRDGTRFGAEARWRPGPGAVGEYLVFSIREEAPSAAPDRDEAREPDLLSIFTHDVSESLQAIQLLCDSVRLGVPEAASTISEIVEAIGRLLDRVGGSSGLTALSAAPEPCAVGRILDVLGRELRPLAARKGLCLTVQRTDEHVTTDPVLFRELLHNLLSNAIRYTEAGRVDVRCRRRETVLRIEVADTGIGFDESALESLRGGGVSAALDDTGARKAGLGLTLVRRLADQLGCSIEIQSTPGRGSCIAVELQRDGFRTT